MTSKHRKSMSLDIMAEQIATEVEKTLDMRLQSDKTFKRLTPEWQKAGKRWAANTAISKALSNLLEVPEPEVVTLLAKKTKNMKPYEELRMAVAEGVRLTGPKFHMALINELKNRLNQ